MSEIPSILLGPEEFHQRFAGRFYGKYRAIVVGNKDPRKRGRVQVSCEGVYGASSSPWALPCMPLAGMPGTGVYAVPPVGSIVWIEFEEGNVEKPIYMGGFWEEALRGQNTDGTPIENSPEHQRNRNPLPMHAQGLPDGTDFDGTVRGSAGAPNSSFAGEYPHVRGYTSPSGHVVEFDDTDGNERVRIMHRTGTTIEILRDGSLVELVDGNRRLWTRSNTSIVAGNETTEVRGNRVETIDGDLTVHVKGRYNMVIDKSITTKKPGGTEAVNGDWIREIAGQAKLDALGNVQILSGGSMGISAFGNAEWAIGGTWSVAVANSMSPGNAMSKAIDISGSGGRVALRSVDPTGLLTSYGVEAMGQESPSNSPAVSPLGVGPQVRLGNLMLPPTPPAPGVNESVPMGHQLWLYLQAMHSFLQLWLTDYLVHAHPKYSPSYTSIAQAPILNTALAAMYSTWLAPTSPQKLPLLLSDVVTLTKL